MKNTRSVIRRRPQPPIAVDIYLEPEAAVPIFSYSLHPPTSIAIPPVPQCWLGTPDMFRAPSEQRSAGMMARGWSKAELADHIVQLQQLLAVM